MMGMIEVKACMQVLNLIRDFELQKRKEFREYFERLLSIANRIDCLVLSLMTLTLLKKFGYHT